MVIEWADDPSRWCCEQDVLPVVDTPWCSLGLRGGLWYKFSTPKKMQLLLMLYLLEHFEIKTEKPLK